MWDCVCGYQGSSEEDLDEHLIQMMHTDDPDGEHRPT
jgi:hypothetical protein